MPISTPSFGSDNDGRDPRFQSDEMYDVDQLHFDGLTAPVAEKLLKQLGGGVADKHELVEGIGWKARIEPVDGGATIHFQAHDELIDDLMRRFEILADRELS
ncbi:MAG: hypothetical protein R2873_19225 [Caldilineaceae bacterium]|nr:hypothetical protein [Caldilineaceae bacterium]